MPGRGEELQLKLRAALPLVLVFLAGPGLLRAQQDPETPQPDGAALAVEGGLRLTSLRDETATLAGGAITLHPGSADRRFSFGGEGWILMNEREIPGDVADSDLLLRMAYGGATVRAVLLRRGRTAVEAGLLAGAGTAKISLAVVGTEIAADNFGVVEPQMAISLAPDSLLSLRLLAGYRGVFGVEDLPRVSPEHIRGWTLGLALGIGPF